MRHSKYVPFYIFRNRKGKDDDAKKGGDSEGAA